jgi:autotransporter adhesin
VLAVCLAAAPAQAQFICGGSATGAEPQAGGGATAGGSTSNFACGPSANASGAGSFNSATGNQADASGANSFNTAMGNLANASGDGSRNTAIGNGANASGAGTNNTAVGTNSTATGNAAAAFGADATATFSGSSAFGAGATTTRAQQQMFGTAGNTYTMAGITSGASAAAQSGPVQIVTSDSGGNLATSTAAGLGLATTSQINAINSQLGALSSTINNVNTEARRGIAATAAMASAPTPSGPGRTTFAINGSFFESVGGVGVAFQHRLAGASTPVYVSGAYGNGGGKEHVGRIGLGFEW